jgi:hypothetical protein
MPFCDVVARFKRNLEECRKHHSNKQWTRIQRDIDTGWIPRGYLLILTDFSATLALRAKAADNSSVDGHAVLAIYVVCSNSRIVETPKGKKTINDCDVWYFFGDTISKGKKNDHVFHNACLNYIVAHYQRKCEQEGKDHINTVKVWTDNCAGQVRMGLSSGLWRDGLSICL